MANVSIKLGENSWCLQFMDGVKYNETCIKFITVTCGCESAHHTRCTT